MASLRSITRFPSYLPQCFNITAPCFLILSGAGILMHDITHGPSFLRVAIAATEIYIGAKIPNHLTYFTQHNHLFYGGRTHSTAQCVSIGLGLSLAAAQWYLFQSVLSKKEIACHLITSLVVSASIIKLHDREIKNPTFSP